MNKIAKKNNKLKIRKLKFVKESAVRYDLQTGGCSSTGSCSHIA